MPIMLRNADDLVCQTISATNHIYMKCTSRARVPVRLPCITRFTA